MRFCRGQPCPILCTPIPTAFVLTIITVTYVGKGVSGHQLRHYLLHKYVARFASEATAELNILFPGSRQIRRRNTSRTQP